MYTNVLQFCTFSISILISRGLPQNPKFDEPLFDHKHGGSLHVTDEGETGDGEPLNNPTDGGLIYAPEEGESRYDSEDVRPPLDIQDGEPLNDPEDGDSPYIPEESESRYDSKDVGPPLDIEDGEPLNDPEDGDLTYIPEEDESRYGEQLNNPTHGGSIHAPEEGESRYYSGDVGPPLNIKDGKPLNGPKDGDPPYISEEGESQYDPENGASLNYQKADSEAWENHDIENAPYGIGDFETMPLFEDNESDDQFDSEETRDHFQLPDSSEILNRNKPEAGFDLSHDEMIKFKLWPDALVPYYIDVHSFSDKVMRDRIRSFLSSVNSLTSLNFVELPSPPSDDSRWVMFMNRRGLLGCADHSIRNFTNSGVQRVVLGYHCMSSEGELAEAVLAIAGVPAQHNSPDRDYYIKINEENIIPEKKFLFEKLTDDEWLFHDVEYDFKSVGHFHSYKHSINGRPTIQPQEQTKDVTIGESKALTASDILKIRMLYNYIVKKKLLQATDCHKLFEPGKKFGQYKPSDKNLKPRPKPFRYIGESPDAPLETDDVERVPDQDHNEIIPLSGKPIIDEQYNPDENNGINNNVPRENENQWPNSQIEEENLSSQYPENKDPNYEYNAPIENLPEPEESHSNLDHILNKHKKPAIIKTMGKDESKVTSKYNIDNIVQLENFKQSHDEPSDNHLAMIKPLSAFSIASNKKNIKTKDPLSALSDYQTDEEKQPLNYNNAKPRPKTLGLGFRGLN